MLVAIVLFCWLTGFALFWRRPVCRHSMEPVPCRFAIVIPARDEERNLPVLLQSIAEQSVQPAQVLVVDDHSSDRTAQIAGEFGATVLESEPLPERWRGKTWACHQGAIAAEADHFLFLDADTRFEKEGLRDIVNEYIAGNGAAMSVGPYHRVHRVHEQLSAFFNLVMTMGLGAFTAWPRENDGLFGPMLMVSRQSYERAGGHERVKARILENLWLARHFRESGTPVRCLLGRGTLSIRMYPSGMGSLIEGWTKGFASGSKATSPWVLAAIVAWLSGAVATTSLFAHCRPIIAVAAYALYAIQILIFLRRIGSFRLYTAVCFPVPLLFFFAVFARSAIRSRTSVTWKGRVIHAD